MEKGPKGGSEAGGGSRSCKVTGGPATSHCAPLLNSHLLPQRALAGEPDRHRAHPSSVLRWPRRLGVLCALAASSSGCCRQDGHGGGRPVLTTVLCGVFHASKEEPEQQLHAWVSILLGPRRLTTQKGKMEREMKILQANTQQATCHGVPPNLGGQTPFAPWRRRWVVPGLREPPRPTGRQGQGRG